MIVVSTYRKNLDTDEGTSWARVDEAEAYSEEAANLAARTLLDDAVESGRDLVDLAVLFEDGRSPEEIDYEGGAFIPAPEYLKTGSRW